jgi:hypothetical protein
MDDAALPPPEPWQAIVRVERPDGSAQRPDVMMMQLLYQMYRPKGTTIAMLRSLPCYDLRSAYGDEDIEQAFYTIFHQDAFRMHEGRWLPNWDHVMKVEDVPYIREAMFFYNYVVEFGEGIRAIVNRAYIATKEEARFGWTDMAKAKWAIHQCFRVRPNRELSADGGESYAELTEGSINKLLAAIKRRFRITEKDISIDGGCGYNFLMAYIAQMTSCKVYSIEYVPTKIYLGIKSSIMAMQHDLLMNYNIAYVPWDMMLLASLGPATIAIFYDEAFTDNLLEYICTMLVKPSTTLKCVVFFKPGKCKTLKEDIEAWGDLEFVEIVPGMSKYAGGGSNTAYLFRPKPNKPQAVHESTCNNTKVLTAVALYDNYLFPVWEAENVMARLEHYRKLLLFAEEMISKKNGPM